ncbi:hypothetical protein MMC22_008835 [Lobaria immixta]|nr:hypothetical protein [Lobaria immixta]
MAVPNGQSTNDLTSENQTVTNEEESGTDNAACSISNNEASNTVGAEIENPSNSDEVPSENPSTNDTISTSSRIEFLSLPPELRVQIFRHLLLEHRPLSTDWIVSAYRPYPAILNTNFLIRREAFQVLYGENMFSIGSSHPRYSILPNRRIRDTIQNIHLSVRLDDPLLYGRRSGFLRLIREFGSPAIVRGTLNVLFHVSAHDNEMFFWFVRGLPRFTNFRSIRFEFMACYPDPIAERLSPTLCNMHEELFTPIFGPATYFANGRGLEYHPQSYLNSLPPVIHVDWMENLDGDRLNWNQDPPANTDEPESSARNSNSESQ